MQKKNYPKIDDCIKGEGFKQIEGITIQLQSEGELKLYEKKGEYFYIKKDKTVVKKDKKKLKGDEIALNFFEKHDNVCSVDFLVKEGPFDYIVMPYVPYGFYEFQKAVCGDPEEAVIQLYYLFKGYDHIKNSQKIKNSGKNFLYCDFKPENICLNDKLQFTIIDFGTLVELGDKKQEKYRSQGYTQGYFPQDANTKIQSDKNRDHKVCLSEETDVYAIALIIIAFFVGKDALDKILKNPKEFLNHNYPRNRPLKSFLAKALSEKKEERMNLKKMQNMEEFAIGLYSFREGHERTVPKLFQEKLYQNVINPIKALLKEPNKLTEARGQMEAEGSKEKKWGNMLLNLGIHGLLKIRKKIFLSKMEDPKEKWNYIEKAERELYEWLEDWKKINNWVIFRKPENVMVDNKITEKLALFNDVDTLLMNLQEKIYLEKLEEPTKRTIITAMTWFNLQLNDCEEMNSTEEAIKDKITETIKMINLQNNNYKRLTILF